MDTWIGLRFVVYGRCLVTGEASVTAIIAGLA